MQILPVFVIVAAVLSLYLSRPSAAPGLVQEFGRRGACAFLPFVPILLLFLFVYVLSTPYKVKTEYLG